MYNIIKSQLLKDISNKIIKTVGITSKTLIEGISLTDCKYMTPIDSVQLASAIQCKKDSESLFFVCSDKKLVGLAEHFKLGGRGTFHLPHVANETSLCHACHEGGYKYVRYRKGMH